VCIVYFRYVYKLLFAFYYYIVCLSSSLSYSAGPISCSFSAEFLKLVYGLEWCHSHLTTCYFQLALDLLSTARAFRQRKFFRDIWTGSDSLSSRIALNFQWVPDNELAYSLAKPEAPPPSTHSVSPVIVKAKKHPLLHLETKSFLQYFLFGQILLISLKEYWPFPASPPQNCPDFDATVTAFFCPFTYTG